VRAKFSHENPQFRRQARPARRGLPFGMTRVTDIVRCLPLLALAALVGCSTAWQSHYRGVEAGIHPPTETVTVREVPWSRLDGTLRAIEARRAASDTHPDEWTAEQHAEERADLLHGLQISESPDDILVLGRSVFRSTDHLSPDDGSLERFARSIGADYAVWSAHHLGTRRVTQQQPVHEHGFHSRRYTDADGRRRTTYEPWDRTVFIPVSVDADEYAWVVYYLRRW
jgi:hypothetical protein